MNIKAESYVSRAPEPFSRPAAFKTKEEYVAEYLREGIIAGRYPRGARLKQDEIAGQLDISITPVREAFRMLEAEGYLLSERHRGVLVAPFDADTAAELTGLRVILECRLVSGAVPKMTRADLSTLRKIQQELEQAARRGERAAIRALNYRFHSTLYGIAGLPETLHFVQILWAKYPFDLIHQVQGRPQRAVTEHAALLRMLAAGDEPGAVEATRAHIESGWRALASGMAKKAAARSPARAGKASA